MKKEEITNDKWTSSQFDSWKQLFTKNLIIEHIYSGNTQQLDPVRYVHRHIYQYSRKRKSNNNEGQKVRTLLEIHVTQLKITAKITK